MNFSAFVLALDLKEFVMTVFMIIGAVVSVIVTLIALVYGTFFIVRLLAKTFSLRVSSSIELMSDSIQEKKLEKKERKKQEREAKFEQKRELHKLKLESIARIGEMKRKKYQQKLTKKEDKTYEKMFGEPNPNSVVNLADEPAEDASFEASYEETPSATVETKDFEPVTPVTHEESGEVETIETVEVVEETPEEVAEVSETTEDSHINHEKIVDFVVAQSFADDGAPVLRGDKIPGGEFDEHSEDVMVEPQKEEDEEKFDLEIDKFKKELLHGETTEKIDPNKTAENESLWSGDDEDETDIENESIHTDETFEKALSKKGRKNKK